MKPVKCEVFLGVDIVAGAMALKLKPDCGDYLSIWFNVRKEVCEAVNRRVRLKIRDCVIQRDE